MAIGPTLILAIIGYLFLLISQRIWSLLNIIILLEIIWVAVNLYLSWVSIDTSNLGILFWAVSTLYISAVELTITLVITLLYNDLLGQSKLW